MSKLLQDFALFPILASVPIYLPIHELDALFSHLLMVTKCLTSSVKAWKVDKTDNLSQCCLAGKSHCWLPSADEQRLINKSCSLCWLIDGHAPTVEMILFKSLEGRWDPSEIVNPWAVPSLMDGWAGVGIMNLFSTWGDTLPDCLSLTRQPQQIEVQGVRLLLFCHEVELGGLAKREADNVRAFFFFFTCQI